MGDQLTTALVVLVVSATFAVVGKAALWSIQFVKDEIKKQRRLREAITEVQIEIHFLRKIISEVTSSEAIEYLKSKIENDPENFRGFVVLPSDDEAYLTYREIRYSLSPQVMFVCDAFFSSVKLFRVYYEKIGSNEFKELPKERKIEAISKLNKLGMEANKRSDFLIKQLDKCYPLNIRLDDYWDDN